jgi:2-hydroxy-3-keto-5-methylthiopentenyl-1-phosphate phosphatase
MNWQLIVDFDGTISLKDTTDLLLHKFAHASWHDIEDEWLSGNIGSRECMMRQIDLIRATPQEMDAFIDGIEIDWHFKSFIRQAQLHDLPITIVSDGLDYIINSVLRRAGIDNLQVNANHLSYKGDGQWRLTSPYATNSCHAQSGTCKCAIAAQRRDKMTLVIGDGRSDRCVAEDADFVFAKSSLVTYCQDKQLPFLPFQDFAHASVLLADLLDTVPMVATNSTLLEDAVFG